MDEKRNTKRIKAGWALIVLTTLILSSCSAGFHTVNQPNDNRTTISSHSDKTDSTAAGETANQIQTNASDAQNTTQAEVINGEISGDSSSSASTNTNTKTAASATAKSTTSQTTAESTAKSTEQTKLPSAVIGKYIVGYYAGWSSSSGYTPDKIKASELTHLNYAFAAIGTDLKVALLDPASDIKNFEYLRKLKSGYPALKTLISIGGWADSARFSDAALTAASRAAFAQSCLDFVRTYGFDGVDLDWEYPVSGGMAGNSSRPADKQNFTYLLQAIRDKFNQQSRQDGKTYSLTIAGGASSEYINKIEIQKVSNLVDYIFIMGYDMHGPWDTYSDFNAPLYAPTENSPQYKIADYDSVSAYIQTGVSPSKLVLGMPFYGRQYTVTSSANNGLYSRFSSARSISYDTVVSGFLNNPVFHQFFHSSARVPYLFGNNTFISYDNAQSIAEKVQFAKARHLAGVGAWELSQDKNAVLLGSAYNTLY